MAEIPVASWSNTDRLKEVLVLAAKRLPPEVGNVLLTLVDPYSLATMVGVLTVWGGAHFFGAGEIADVVLVTLGWLALGGVALEAGVELFEFAMKTLRGTSRADLDKAAQHLAKAISLIGVQAVLAILMKKPNVLRNEFTRTPPLAPFTKMQPMPRTPGLFYKLKIRFTKTKMAGAAATDAAGDSVIGRDHFGNAAGAAIQVRKAAFHEAMHRFLTPRLQIFREFRVYLKQSAYRKSYILRYLEEALCETYALLRQYGLGKEHFIAGLKFPLGSTYEINVVQVGPGGEGHLAWAHHDCWHGVQGFRG